MNLQSSYLRNASSSSSIVMATARRQPPVGRRSCAAALDRFFRGTGSIVRAQASASFVGNIEHRAARLAMTGVNLVALKPASWARIADLVGPHERL